MWQHRQPPDPYGRVRAPREGAPGKGGSLGKGGPLGKGGFPGKGGPGKGGPDPYLLDERGAWLAKSPLRAAAGFLAEFLGERGQGHVGRVQIPAELAPTQHASEF